MTIRQQKKFALALLDWHGGMASGLYAVGSCMLSDSERGSTYNPANHLGHIENAMPDAIRELTRLKEGARYPDCVTAQAVRACTALARKLSKFNITHA